MLTNKMELKDYVQLDGQVIDVHNIDDQRHRTAAISAAILTDMLSVDKSNDDFGLMSILKICSLGRYARVFKDVWLSKKLDEYTQVAESMKRDLELLMHTLEQTLTTISNELIYPWNDGLMNILLGIYYIHIWSYQLDYLVAAIDQPQNESLVKWL